MALPVITNWPFKVIDGYKSEWNAASLPIIYDITNTKWPTNSEDGTVAITSISDDNGLARLNHGSSTGLVAKGWVLVAGATDDDYNGAHQIVSVSGNNLTIDLAFAASDTGTSQRYYQNYTSLVRVYAGIDPAHTHAATKPIELIGTIEQRPDTDNITLANVRDYVKDKLNTVYDESQASWPNDLNGWTDFYISFAERYDLVTAGEVTDFTSEYRDDEADGGINYLKAVHGGLQFGAARGGNMHDYVIKDSPYSDVALWMTDFIRPKIIGDQNFNLSIISEDVLNSSLINIDRYDKNGDLLGTDENALLNNSDYGLYRLPVSFTDSDDLSYLMLTLYAVDWAQTGNDLNISGNTHQIAALTSARIAYFGSTDDDLRAYEFDGTDWAQVGNDLNIPGVTSIVGLAGLSSSQVAYFDRDNQDIRTYEFDGTDWAQVGNDFFIAGSPISPVIAALTSARIVLTFELPPSTLQVYDFDGTDWFAVGNAFGLGAVTSPVVAALTSARIAYIDATNLDLRTYEFDGTDWAQVGNDLNIGQWGTMTAISNDTIVLANTSADQIQSYKFDGTDWVSVGTDIDISSMGTPSITTLSNIAVAFIDSTNDDLRTYTLEKSAVLSDEITIDIE